MASSTHDEEYETHITVRLNERDETAGLFALQEWAADRGLKCIHIVLNRGAAASQPMLTRHGRGTLPGERAVAATLGAELTDAGFTVTRIKIEAAPFNQSVPQTATAAEETATKQPPDRYFEHHVKLLLAPGADTATLLQTVVPHNAHLSRNALKRRAENGGEERFVTQRCAASRGRAEAHERLTALLSSLAPLGHTVLDVEEEFVVYDSNVDLDAGWLPGENT